jgi:hypothetical protein
MQIKSLAIRIQCPRSKIFYFYDPSNFRFQNSELLIKFFFLSASHLPTFSTSFFSAMRYALRAMLLHSNVLIRFFFLSPSQFPTFSTSFFSAFPPGRRRRPLWAGGRIDSRGIVQRPAITIQNFCRKYLAHRNGRGR